MGHAKGSCLFWISERNIGCIPTIICRERSTGSTEDTPNHEKRNGDGLIYISSIAIQWQSKAQGVECQTQKRQVHQELTPSGGIAKEVEQQGGKRGWKQFGDGQMQAEFAGFLVGFVNQAMRPIASQGIKARVISVRFHRIQATFFLIEIIHVKLRQGDWPLLGSKVENTADLQDSPLACPQVIRTASRCYYHPRLVYAVDRV